jgi:GNAT superfamily N-acetyltransferase
MSTTISLIGTPEAQERRAKAQAAVDEFVKDKPSGPVLKSVWLGEGYIELAAFNNRVHLSAVYVVPEQRRKTLGSAYLKQLLDIVDKHGAEVQCRVEPFGPQSPESKMGLRELAQWYKRHGFKTVPGRHHFLLRPATPG